MAGAVCRVGRTFRLGPVDLSVEPGAVCGVGGPNGAGKTTLLRVVAGLLPLTLGTRTVDGRALYLRSGAGARGGQRVADAIAVAAALAGRDVDPMGALDTVGMSGMAWRRVRSLSSGERARLTLALAAAVDPEVLCLDEPFAHLDGAGGDIVRSVVARLAGAGTAVVIASPRRADVGTLADAMLTVDDGTVRIA